MNTIDPLDQEEHCCRQDQKNINIYINIYLFKV